MKNKYSIPTLKISDISLEDIILAGEADGGSFPAVWNDVDDKYMDEF